MLKRFFTLLILVLTIVASSFAAPISLMETIKGEKQITLNSLHISSVISGNMAQTTIKMEFYNPNNRPLEGNLQFPLLDNQQITAFALDFDGQMHPAVTVEKNKGREIFESIERKNIDPALLEKTQGNNFKLRVYPIEAKKTRMVELTYIEPLIKTEKNLTYRIPLTSYGQNLKNFSLSLVINGGNTLPKASGALGNIDFVKNGNGYKAKIIKKAFTPTGTITLSLPTQTQTQTYLQDYKGTTYFLSEIPITYKPTPRVLPKVIGLLWDSSGSMQSRSLETELQLLEQYFKALGNAEVRLTRLRDHAEEVETFKITNGNWTTLRDALKNTVYDGASALGDWKVQDDVDEYLLFSDGLMNYGNTLFPALEKSQRLYTVSSSLSCDASRLFALAKENRGSFIQIIPGKITSATNALLNENLHISSIEPQGVSDVLLDESSAEEGFIRLAGKLTSQNAHILLTMTRDGKTHNITIPINANAPKNPLSAYMWATYKLSALDANYELNRGAIRRIGTEFSIPTRETSLIVLENVEDYLLYDVTPPEELKELVLELKAIESLKLKEKRATHLKRVMSDLNAKISWWEKTYPKDTPPKPKPVNTTHDRDGVRAMSVMTYATAPAPMMVMEKSAAPMESAPPPAPIGITLKKWKSNAPYIARMNSATKEDIYAIYLDEKPSYENSSAFFLDAADMLIEKGQPELALRVLSNLAEMDLENRHVLRILGYRLLQLQASKQAVEVFKKVLLLGEEEPQSYRDLGLAYEAIGQYQEAINFLNEVVERPWDDRFAEVELIALAELNAILAKANEQNIPLDTSHIDPRFLKNMPLDIRAVLTWDADNSDMDLWVSDPNEEKCYYGHRFTYQGGRMSRDFTGGYGPEEFSLRVAKPGKYKVEANFYGNRQQSVAGATTLQLKLTTHFGTAYAKDQMITLRLKERSETVFVGEFEVK